MIAEFSNEFINKKSALSLVIGVLKLDTDYNFLYFEDNSGIIYDYTRLQFLNQSWNNIQGIKFFPGIQVMEGGKITKMGDTILALKGNSLTKTIVILGSLKSLNYTHAIDALNTGADKSDLEEFAFVRNNEQRAFIVKETADGLFEIVINTVDETNNNSGMRLIVNGKGKLSGYIDIIANGDIILCRMDKEDKLISQITMSTESFEIKDKFANTVIFSESGLKIKSEKGITIGSEKISIGKNDNTESLHKILSDILDTIQSMNFLHPQGPTTAILPDAKLKFQNISKRINNFLKVN